MTAFVQTTGIISTGAVFGSVAAGDSVTLVNPATFFSTNSSGVIIGHANHSVINMATLMAAGGYGVLLNNVDDCDILNTATGTIGNVVTTSGFEAVLMLSDRSALQNAGTIYSANGDGVGVDGNNTVVLNSGTITARDVGIEMQGTGITINNSGTIETTTGAFQAGVYLGAGGGLRTLVNSGLILSSTTLGNGIGVQIAGGGQTLIDNAGTIRSANGVAVDASTSSGTLHLTNSGTITSSVNFVASVAATELSDTIINTGSINRSVLLAGGDDLFDGIGGTVGGTIFGGDGSDIYRISDAGQAIFEAGGEGLADRVESTVSFALAAGSEVEGLTLLGTATDGTGNEFNNTITGNGMDNRLGGVGGNDTVDGMAGDDSLRGDTGTDLVNGGDGDDLLRGGAATDTLYGGDGNDEIWGDVAGDRLFGDAGDDVLVGGAGRDTLYGGADADTFVFRAVADSGVGVLRDIIVGFEAGLDVIDLTRIDADTALIGNQAFTFIGTAGFSNVAGQLRLVTGPISVLQGDVNGDSVADFEVQLNAVATVSGNDLLL